MQLTKHFKLSELTVTKTGIDNTPNPEHLPHLYQLAYALEVMRAGAYASRPLIITSAYRNPRVNKAVGGVPNSAHTDGYAADFYVPNMTHLRLAQTGAAYLSANNIPFDQFIYETSRGIVHLSIDPANRRQILTQSGGPGSPVVAGIVSGG